MERERDLREVSAPSPLSILSLSLCPSYPYPPFLSKPLITFPCSFLSLLLSLLSLPFLFIFPPNPYHLSLSLSMSFSSRYPKVMEAAAAHHRPQGLTFTYGTAGFRMKYVLF